MFTIKQLNADSTEFLTGPYESVEMVRDSEQPDYWVVRGLNGPNGHAYQAGPFLGEAPANAVQPRVWVMNEAGSTVAKYLL